MLINILFEIAYLEREIEKPYSSQCMLTPILFYRHLNFKPFVIGKERKQPIKTECIFPDINGGLFFTVLFKMLHAKLSIHFL